MVTREMQYAKDKSGVKVTVLSIEKYKIGIRLAIVDDKGVELINSPPRLLCVGDTCTTYPGKPAFTKQPPMEDLKYSSEVKRDHWERSLRMKTIDQSSADRKSYDHETNKIELTIKQVLSYIIMGIKNGNHVAAMNLAQEYLDGFEELIKKRKVMLPDFNPEVDELLDDMVAKRPGMKTYCEHCALYTLGTAVSVFVVSVI